MVLALGSSSSRFEGALFDDNGAAIVHHEKEKKSRQMRQRLFVFRKTKAWAMDCGEGMDSSTLCLPGDQNDWFC